MCEFCENIAKDDEAFVKMRRKQQKEFIFISNNKFHVFVDTGDSFCPGILNDTKFCPKCGRDLRKQIDERANS